MAEFDICWVSPDECEAALSFHRESATEYIWPRTEAQISAFAADHTLYALYDVTSSRRMIGLCYIAEGDSPDGALRWEFGGVTVLKEYQKQGLAAALGRVAIGNHLFGEPNSPMPLIAHVHEFNPDPITLLTKRLGFVRTGTEIPPPDAAPASMKRNTDGQVVGHLYTFQSNELAKFADYFEEWGKTETVPGSAGTDLSISIYNFEPVRRDALVTALRKIAAS